VKQVVQNYKSGELALADVPVPACKPGGVLVRTAFSLISTGTELMKVSEAGMSMLGKARSRPDQVAKVMQSVAANGLTATYRKVLNRLGFLYAAGIFAVRSGRAGRCGHRRCRGR
jgi:hypothetical protein